jgi:LPS export ABC transporter protein LptC
MRAGLPVLLCLGLTACKNDLDRVAAIELERGGPDRITYTAEYLYSDSGRVTNRIRAGMISEFMGEHPRTEMSEGVELRFFDRNGREGSRLTAQRGTITPEDDRMQVDGDVVFVNARGERLETEQLIWSQDSDRVWTDRPVRIRRAHDIIHGQGLDAEQDFSRYTVRNITGILYLADGDTLAPVQPAR